MVLRCVRENSAIIFYCFWPLLPLSNHLVYGLISMFVVCTMLLSVYMVYVKLLAVTWNYTYRKLEIACNRLSSVNLSRWVWTSSRKKPALWLDSCKFWVIAYERFECIYFSVILSAVTCLLSPALKCNCISFSEWLVRDLAWGRNNKAKKELHVLVNH